MILDTPSAPLSSPTEAADDLTATNAPDLLANEQTWPTEEEMASSNGIAAGGSEGKRVKRVPKGTSAYQAAWIFDDEDDPDDDEDDDRDGEMEVEGDQPVNGTNGTEEHEEMEDVELDSRRGQTHRDLDPEEEEAEYVHRHLSARSLICTGTRTTSETENEHTATTCSSLTRSTHLAMSQLGPDSSAIEASKASGRALGIPTRTCPWTMRGSSSLRTSRRRNAG